ncbi:transcriptional regulator with XRE-family HTH domain [Streptomyces umbrinus]|uniref:Transcriptional regulator with XRE-family HTH domain n=1 Tax=Streptomyces umbrinus TaxID=67370 RepID=A0ABU0SIV8_9ACTN|nr:SsgA family sporulation/cell division regulator [Streptomyces umbrinus]MDQ1022616.1 transcriptional regulator with XRE-family HTH domain [Streptomyces umbrinus]
MAGPSSDNRISIAVVGEYSAGKSLLLNELLGEAVQATHGMNAADGGTVLVDFPGIGLTMAEPGPSPRLAAAQSPRARDAVHYLRLRKHLRMARQRAGLTQVQAAEALDWSPAKVIRIENGSIGISAAVLQELLRVYGVSDPHQVERFAEAQCRSRCVRRTASPYAEFGTYAEHCLEAAVRRSTDMAAATFGVWLAGRDAAQQSWADYCAALMARRPFGRLEESVFRAVCLHLVSGRGDEAAGHIRYGRPLLGRPADLGAVWSPDACAAAACLSWPSMPSVCEGMEWGLTLEPLAGTTVLSAHIVGQWWDSAVTPRWCGNSPHRGGGDTATPHYSPPAWLRMEAACAGAALQPSAVVPVEDGWTPGCWHDTSDRPRSSASREPSLSRDLALARTVHPSTARPREHPPGSGQYRLDGKPELHAELIMALYTEGHSKNLRLRGLLTYRTSDPYAVHAAFHDGRGETIWRLARDLLTDGLEQRVGLGDVAVWSQGADTDVHHRCTFLQLRSVQGNALLVMSRQELRAFLLQTQRLVPQGGEYPHCQGALSTVEDQMHRRARLPGRG